MPIAPAEAGRSSNAAAEIRSAPLNNASFANRWKALTAKAPSKASTSKSLTKIKAPRKMLGPATPASKSSKGEPIHLLPFF